MTSEETESLIDRTEHGYITVRELADALLREHRRAQSSAEARRWQPIETAPPGYDWERFHPVLFLGHSKGRSFDGTTIVQGWMSHKREPVHNYNYKLVITHWMPLPPTP